MARLTRAQLDLEVCGALSLPHDVQVFHFHLHQALERLVFLMILKEENGCLRCVVEAVVDE